MDVSAVMYWMWWGNSVINIMTIFCGQVDWSEWLKLFTFQRIQYTRELLTRTKDYFSILPVVHTRHSRVNVDFAGKFVIVNGTCCVVWCGEKRQSESLVSLFLFEVCAFTVSWVCVLCRTTVGRIRSCVVVMLRTVEN